MSIFLLPKISYEIKDEDIKFKMVESTPGPFISNSLYEMLSKTKLQIEPIENNWDNYKKLTNPYEFIHTVVPGCKTQVSRMKPLSRSFYKMVEICTQFNLCHSGNNNNSNDVINDIFTSSCGNVGNNHINQNNTFMHFVVPDSASLASQSASPKMTSFHLAEGPGGFIEAVCFMRKNPNDVYYGMTLVNSNSKCPGWKKSKTFLEENPNVIIEKGIDETGNLLSIENFKYCYEKYGGKIEFITGDGGVDFSEND